MRDISVNGVSLLQSWAPALGSQLIVTFVGKKQAQTEIRCEVSYVSEQANKLFAVGCIFLQIESNTPAPSTPPAPAK